MTTTCPGCGLSLPSAEWPEAGGLNASRECFQLFGELSSRTLVLRDPEFAHQHAVDAYAAQHASDESPPIRTAFALIGLCLASERGASGRAVQVEHMRLARSRRQWPRFMRRIGAAITVADVFAERATLQQWMASVWKEWEADHARVRALIDSP